MKFTDAPKVPSPAPKPPTMPQQDANTSPAKRQDAGHPHRLAGRHTGGELITEHHRKAKR